MGKILMLLICIAAVQCYAHNATLQKKDSITIIKDTINLRGVVYGLDGKPAKNIEIGLLQGEFFPDASASITSTDTNGRFELKGAKINDTLRIVDERYCYATFSNFGSRYMVIYLPPPQILAVNTESIDVKAPRKVRKKIPSFRADDGRFVFDNSVLGLIVYPEFKGGPAEFRKYITQGLIYPDKAIEANIEGEVQAVFTINRDGSIGDIVIVRGIGYGCDEQLVTSIKNAGKWRPGIFCGRPMTVQKTISVKFSLTDN